MKTAKIYLLLAVGILLFVFAFCAIDSAQTTGGKVVEPKPDSPKLDKKEALTDSQVKIMRARVNLSDSRAQMAMLESKFQSYQAQVKDLQTQAGPLQQKIALQEGILKSEIDAAAKAVGLDPEKYEFDQEKLVFSPKVEPAKPTPSPEKK